MLITLISSHSATGEDVLISDSSRMSHDKSAICIPLSTRWWARHSSGDQSIHSLICMSKVMCEYLVRNHVEKESFHSAARLIYLQTGSRKIVTRLVSSVSWFTCGTDWFVMNALEIEKLHSFSHHLFYLSFAGLVMVSSVCYHPREFFWVQLLRTRLLINQLEQPAGQTDGQTDLDKMIARQHFQDEIISLSESFNSKIQQSFFAHTFPVFVVAASRSQLNSK